MKRILLPLILPVLICAPAQASVVSDLHKQVRLELAGDGESCRLMTPEYQSLFSTAAAWFEAGESCQEGVEVMHNLRRKSSGENYVKQTRRQLQAILKGKVRKTAQTLATVAVRYRGTPPGWKFRPRSNTAETYQVELLEERWSTESVKALVRPPVARPTE